jgi:hypothetical protein
MLRLRRLDGPGLRAYLDELRPRVLVVRIRARRLRLLWAVPMAPFEEVLAFALGLALLVPTAARFLPEATRARLERDGGLLAAASQAAAGACVATKAGDPGSEAARELPQGLLARLSLIAAGGLGEALRLPPGTPYLSLQAEGVTIDVRPY